MGLVGLESLEEVSEKEQLFNFIKEHVEMTGSTVGQAMLEDWDNSVKSFVKVMPHDYKRVLEERAAAKVQAA
jgi:glutamate synthase domain-containing protein 3